MKNANEVLRQKEADLTRLRHEIESLKIVAALLADGDSNVEDVSSTSDEPEGEPVTNAEAVTTTDIDDAATGTHGLFSSLSDRRPKRWNVLKRNS